MVQLPDIKRPNLAAIYFERVRGTLDDPRLDLAFKLIRQLVKEKRVKALISIRDEINQMIRRESD